MPGLIALTGAVGVIVEALESERPASTFRFLVQSNRNQPGLLDSEIRRPRVWRQRAKASLEGRQEVRRGALACPEC